MNGARIADVDGLSTDDTFLFRVRPVEGGDEREAILYRLGDGRRPTNGDELAGPDAAADRDGSADGGDSAGGDGSVDGDASADSDGSVGENGDEGVACWVNACQHFRHIKLDKGSGAPFRDGEILCTNHGAMFATDTGECTYGPCEGAYLEPIGVTVTDGGVYLTDVAYEFVAVGPEPSDPTALSSSSNVEF